MAIRKTQFITKNSDIVNRPLPSSLKAGEAIVNTADGIVWYSGVTSSTNEWTPAGTGATANYFEVGSNLYDLQLRNQITSYQDINGAGLVGKFLSGTTSGFVLADITDIADSTDSFVTGGTYNPSTDEITLDLSLGRPSVTITGITDTFVTGVTWSPNTLTINSDDGSSVTTTIDTFDDLTVTNGLNALGGITATTIDSTSINSSSILSGGTDLITIIDDRDNYTTGATLFGSTLYFNTIDSLSAYTADLSSLDINDTFVTGVTYSNSLLTVSRNEGQPDITTVIDTVSGLTISNLTAGRVVYVGAGGELVDEAGFEYNDTTDTLLAGNINTSAAGTAFVGTGGLTVGSGGSVNTSGTGDVVIHGNLTVFGDAITASTSELYIEDNNIILNFNPTTDTSPSSVGAGLTIQDGNGIASGNVTLDVRAMNGFTGLTATDIPDITEYTGPTGYENRAWVTQLNDIVIRSSDTNTPNGVRVLAEFDCLDGGTY